MEYMCGSKKDEDKYALHNNDRFVHTLSYLKKIIKNEKRMQVLDIGTSPLTFLIKNAFPRISLYTLDYGNVFKDRCAQKGIKFIRYDLSKPSKPIFGQQFDAILFLETLEHIRTNHAKLAQFLVRHLKPGGYLIIQTTNRNSFRAQALKLISGWWHKQTYHHNTTEEFEHAKEYTLDELLGMLSKIKEAKVIQSGYPIYYDKPSSTLVYRTNPTLFKPFMLAYYLIAAMKREWRAGLEIIIKKESP